MIECELGLGTPGQNQEQEPAIRVRKLEQLAEIQKYRAENAEHRVRMLEAELSRWRNLHPVKILPELR